MVEKVFG